MTESSSKYPTKLATALIKAKASFRPIIKNKANSYHKSKYASLDAVLEAIQTSLTEEGLLLLQPIEFDGTKTMLVTVIIHGESGEKIESKMEVPAQSDPQKFGSLLTYYRRFAICSLLAIVADDDDDDGNSNMQQKSQATTQNQSAKKHQDNYKVNPPPPEPVLVTYSHQIGHIDERRQALKDCFEALGWSVQQQKDWAQTITKKPSKDWDLRTWDLALVDLQEHIDREGLAQKLIEAGADY